jgi:hypothetical protein
MNSGLAPLKRPCTAIYGGDRYSLSFLVDEQGREFGACTSTIEVPACFLLPEFAPTLRECNEIRLRPFHHPLELAG